MAAAHSLTGLAGELVRRFGDVEAMGKLYAPQVVWRLPASLGALSGPHEGKAAVLAFNRRIWGEVYEPHGVSVEILDALDGGQISAARFAYRAYFRGNDHLYENTYALFVRQAGGLIVQVDEMLDTLAAVSARPPRIAPGD